MSSNNNQNDHDLFSIDATVDKLAKALEERMARRFYTNFGRGMWGMVWRLFLVGCLAIAAYGFYIRGD